MTTELIERARAIYLRYMRETAEAKGDTLAEGQAEKCLAGEMDGQHGVKIALLALTPAPTPAREGGAKPDIHGMHMTHCNHGDYDGSCKYGEDEAYPALTPAPTTTEGWPDYYINLPDEVQSAVEAEIMGVRCAVIDPKLAPVYAEAAFNGLRSFFATPAREGVELPEEPSDAVIRAVDKAAHEHWPNARKMAVGMYKVIREAALTPTPPTAADPKDCEVCGGDCSSANPPMSYCPIRDGRTPTAAQPEEAR